MEIDLRAIEEIRARHGLPAGDVVPFTDGSNPVVSVGDRFVVKVLPPEHRHHWESERRVLPVVHGAGLSVPVPELIAEGERADGSTYVVMSQLPGTVLEEVWGDLPSTEKARLLEAIGSVMAEVQGLPLGPLRSLEPRWENFLDAQETGCVSRHLRLGAPEWLSGEVAEFVRGSRRLLPTAFEPVILTGEFTPFNLLVEKRSGRWELCGMIDFGDAMVGFREYDLLGPSLFLAGGDAGLVRALLRGYGTEMGAELRRRLMVLQLLHRYSNFKAQLRIPGWESAVSGIVGLERLIWPV